MSAVEPLYSVSVLFGRESAGSDYPCLFVRNMKTRFDQIRPLLLLFLSILISTPLCVLAEERNLVLATTQPARSDVLITKSFVVIIVDQSEEGNVESDHVIFVCLNKTNGESVRLVGRTLHSIARDGSPGVFHGYMFKKDDITYYVHEAGSLEVILGKKEVLVDEQGVWAR